MFESPCLQPQSYCLATPLLSLFTTLVLIMATWGKFVNIFIVRCPGGRHHNIIKTLPITSVVVNKQI